MSQRFIVLFLSVLTSSIVSLGYTQDHSPRDNSFDLGCKCGPRDECWPTFEEWGALNSSVSGKLIQNSPPAISCYPGPQQNDATCAAITTELTNSTFVANDPVALDYPVDDGCPVPLAGQPLGNCSLGGIPVYTVNATCPEDVALAIDFARNHNIRLVVRNTGHDILGRSTGYGSLEVWIRYLRQGITFQNQYAASDGCPSSWSGSALMISGGYVWKDAYSVAQENDVVIVGGGDPSVGCIGGWAQGGGHSPASRDFGLGADQILEAQVALADGRVVTANPCQNSDIYTAIRGGGGGTYGVVLSTTVKAHPQTNVVAQILSLAPTSDAYILEFMDALAMMYSAYPDFNDAGFSGYGSWAVESNAPVVGNSATGYNHVIAMFNKSLSEAEAAFAPVETQFSEQNGTSIAVNVTYLEFPTYQAYYQTLSGNQGTVGTSGAVGSHFLDRSALTKSKSALLEMLNVTAGAPGQFISTNVALVSGGQVHADASDKFSGVNPDWRTAYVHNIVAGGWAPGSNASVIATKHHDITYNKIGALRKLAPDLGSYMNEADMFDPLYLSDFYGGRLAFLEGVKERYDPLSVFYCRTCVGSNLWEEDGEGRLCYRG
ncbi:FAD-linked oxidoreductase hmp9 [Lachnellula suecica]|uniref:FAD-linked oxidoreductase hmp9 n=1 Tax=Lachnellula suecica TaxID=602035 RepID=A0A8T9C290_9HELO|nr:FAD-linked oxidoreductase hmp9 [Lachnellula suecica]